MARRKNNKNTKPAPKDTIEVVVKKTFVADAASAKDVVEINQEQQAWQEAVLAGTTNAGMNEAHRIDVIDVSDHVRNTWRDDVMEGLTTVGVRAWLSTP